MSKHPCVYFIESLGLVKIGVASDLPKRLWAIASQSAMPVRLVGFIAIADGDPFGREAALHHRFKHVRAHHEWFKLTVAEAGECLEREGGTITSDPNSVPARTQEAAIGQDVSISLPDGENLKPSDVADVLNVNVETLRRWIRRGLVRSVLVGPHRAVRIPVDEVRRLFLVEGTTA